MAKLTVGVLRGGPSSEYDVSLKSGAEILRALPEDKYNKRDIFIDRNGEWHWLGMPRTPDKALRGVDVVVNGLHGEFGEDGRVQQLLDRFGVPYTGSDMLTSRTCINKMLTKERLKDSGILLPHSKTLSVSENLNQEVFDLFRTFPQPSVIKPVASGSSLGVTVARGYHDFVNGIADAFNYSPKVIVEEYINGREATCGVIDNFRGDEYYTLFPTEIIPASGRKFYDNVSKYDGSTTKLCPGRFTDMEKKELRRLAALAHRTLGARHYSRSDFMVTPRGVYFLEINTLPGFSSESNFPKALKAAGTSIREFLDHIIGLAMGRK